MEQRGKQCDVRLWRGDWIPQGKHLLLGGRVLGVAFLAVLMSVEGFMVPFTLQAAVIPPSEGSTALESHRQVKRGFAQIAKAVRPAVVNITVVRAVTPSAIPGPFERPRGFGEHQNFGFPVPPTQRPGQRQMGIGSGVLVSPDGYVLTNNHVVEGAQTVTVTLIDKRKFAGKVVGRDAQTDLAVVKIKGHHFPFLTWGDSSKLQVGEFVLAIGNPFGLTSTVTQGIVSALGRGGMGVTQYEDFIQTDAAINPGNSGGALVNAQGNLVGINTAIISRTGGYQGIGFAVPEEMAKSVYASLVEKGKVVRGYLGVGIQEMTPDLAKNFGLKQTGGALVTEVKPHSPAAMAGLKRGDTIIKYQQTVIHHPRDLQKAVFRTPVDTSVSITVIRDGQTRTLQTSIQEHSDHVRLAQRPDGPTERGLAGMTVAPLDPHSARELGVTASTQGVVVTAVEPGSPADEAGLSQGDVIREVNKQRIRSVEDYVRATASLKHDQRTLLFISRAGMSLYVSLKV